MNKWKCGICNTEFENYYVYTIEGIIHCPLCYYKELYKSYNQEIVKLRTIIKEVREYINRKDICIDTRKTDGSLDYVDLQKELLEILDKVNKENKE